jgi:hypothetical protein
MARGLCGEIGCGLPHQGRGLCNKHYQRLLRKEARQRREAAGTNRRRLRCAEPGCERWAQGHGLCGTHYQRAKRAGLFAGLPRCTREGCRWPADAHGLCRTHYSALKRRKLGIVERPPAVLGRGRYHAPNGYIMIHRPDHPNAGLNGHVFEHRFVMSEHLGRPLESHETVHHKNGDRADNRLENLELWSCAQPRGQRVEDKLKWCREFLAAYEPKQPA